MEVLVLQTEDNKYWKMSGSALLKELNSSKVIYSEHVFDPKEYFVIKYIKK